MTNTINECTDETGRSVYAQWLENVRDPRAKARIILQVDKLELGLFGDSQPIGAGLSELRIHYGPGYRVYYGKEGTHKYLLLLGGNKSTQSKDIKLAKKYWKDHEQRTGKGR
jgi:putative addiction module killer protein